MQAGSNKKVLLRVKLSFDTTEPVLRVYREWVRVSLVMPNPCFKSSEDLQRRHCAELVAP